MAVKASGSSLAFSEIEAEFGQNSDRDLGEYRVSQTVGGLSNQPLDTNIPQSGAIKFSDFYSKRLNVVIDYHSGSTENRPSDARTKYQAGSTSGNRTVIGGFRDRISGNSSGSKVRIHVNKTIGSAVGNVNNCAVRTGTTWEPGTVLSVEVGSSGLISGAGGDGGNAGKYYVYDTKLEGQDIQDFEKGTSTAKPFTLSFYVKCNINRVFTCELRDLDNGRVCVQQYTTTNSNWTRYELTFPADTTGAFGNDNGASLWVRFWLAAGSNFTSGTARTAWALSLIHI